MFPPYAPLRSGKRARCVEACDAAPNAASSTAATPPSPTPPPLPFSFDILRRLTERGERDPSFYWSNDLVHVMYDAFPKASVHLLVLPRDTTIDSLLTLARRVDQRRMTDGAVVVPAVPGGIAEGSASSVASATAVISPSSSSSPPNVRNPLETQEKQLLLLREMVRVGTAIVQHLQTQRIEGGGALSAPLSYQMGFHAVPSLKHLHMHVMSQDFENGVAMKNKKHYQSFATSFFVPASAVVRLFEAAVEVPQGAAGGTSPLGPATAQTSKLEGQLAAWKPLEALLTAKEMACFWCGQSAKTMPVLLGHLRDCPRRRR